MAIVNALSWCDENMQRLYPLADDATGVSVSGTSLPPSFLVDVQLVLPKMDAMDAENRFYISSVVRTLDAFKVEISYQADTQTSILCGTTTNIPAALTNTGSLSDRTFDVVSTIPGNAAYPQLDDLSGKLIIGTCRDMLDKGVLQFQYNATKLIGVRVYFYEGSFDSITFEGPNTSYTMTKNFTIKAGSGISFSLDSSGPEPVITIYSESGLNQQTPYGNVEDVVKAIWSAMGNPIRMINGIVPDAIGNIDIEGTECLTVSQEAGVLTLANPCGKPCCTEETSQDVREHLAFLDEAQQRLLQTYNAIYESINTMQAKLVSMLNT